MFVKPAPGLKVRDPASRQHIPETGREVPDSDSYWVRRVIDGDVIVVDSSKPAEPAPKKAKG